MLISCPILFFEGGNNHGGCRRTTTGWGGARAVCGWPGDLHTRWPQWRLGPASIPVITCKLAHFVRKRMCDEKKTKNMYIRSFVHVPLGIAATSLTLSSVASANTSRVVSLAIVLAVHLLFPECVGFCNRERVLGEVGDTTCQQKSCL